MPYRVKFVDIVDSEHHIAKVDVAGVRRNVNVGLLRKSSEGVDIGDWVLIHVGFALSKVDEEEAARLLAHLDFDLDMFLENLDKVNPGVQHMLVSARTGAGVEEFCEWLAAVPSERNRKLSAPG